MTYNLSGIYLFNEWNLFIVNNKDNKQCQLCRFCVFIVNFEQILPVVLVSPLLILNKYIPGKMLLETVILKAAFNDQIHFKHHKKNEIKSSTPSLIILDLFTLWKTVHYKPRRWWHSCTLGYCFHPSNDQVWPSKKTFSIFFDF